MDADVVQSRDVVARATGDMSRLAIWQQMLAAIQAQPWFGYGWYQTSVAFVSISDTVQGPVWIRSAHNFILGFFALEWTDHRSAFLGIFWLFGLSVTTLGEYARVCHWILMMGLL